jgi:hypothetical protein
MNDRHFDGPCPFPMCPTIEPHSHLVCPTCSAVWFGSLDCETCQQRHRDEARQREAAATTLHAGEL